MLTLYDLFKSKEQQISLVLLVGKNTIETMQQPFFLKKR